MNLPHPPNRTEERRDQALDLLAAARLRRRGVVSAIVQGIERLRQNSLELRHYAEPAEHVEAIEAFIAQQDAQMEAALRDYLRLERPEALP